VVVKGYGEQPLMLLANLEVDRVGALRVLEVYLTQYCSPLRFSPPKNLGERPLTLRIFGTHQGGKRFEMRLI
jgi:hypothetical protein